MFHRHRWTGWSKPFVTVSRESAGSFGDTREVRTTVQARNCADEACNLTEIRTVHRGTLVKDET